MYYASWPTKGFVWMNVFQQPYIQKVGDLMSRRWHDLYTNNLNYETCEKPQTYSYLMKNMKNLKHINSYLILNLKKSTCKL